MIRFRKWFGWFALLVLALSLNLLVWTQQFFSVMVLLPLAVAALCGIFWLALRLLSLVEQQTLEERTVGGLNAVFSSVLFFGICVVLYLFLVSWNASWDLTEEGRRDLSEQTIHVLQAMNTQVEVLCFFLQVEEELVAIARDKTLRFIEQCRQYTPLLKVEVLDPTVDRARLEAMKITHASVQGTIVLRAGERQRVITLTGGSPRLEERDFTNALINVLRTSEPTVYFMTGHHERDIMDEDAQKGASTFGNLLRGESYKTERLAIKISDPEIPADADIIVINYPSSDFHPVEIEALDNFVNTGGRLVLLIDPWRTPAGSGTAQERLRPFFERRFGIKIGSDLVVTDKSSNIWQAELSVDNTPFEQVEDGFMAYRGAYSLQHPITRSFDQSMLLQAMRSVSVSPKLPEGVAAVELLRAPPDFWAETDTEKLLETGQAKWDEGERKGPIPLAAAAVLSLDKTQTPRGRADARVLVVGDSDFASNANIIVPGHVNFLLNAFAWLTESEDLIAIRPTGRESLPLLLTPLQQRAIAWVAIMLTIQAVLASGLAAYLLRRRHQ